MGEPEPDLYRVLGISSDAAAADITRAYRRRARAVHPDTAAPGAEDPARFRAVSEAYQVLSDPSRRAGYDRARDQRAARAHGPQARRPARSGPAAGMPRAWPRVPPGPGPAGTPALWAGPVRVEPPPAAAASGPGPGTVRPAGAAGRAGLLRWYLGGRQVDLW